MAKYYDPVLCMVVEEPATKANDSKTCDGKNEYEIHYTVPGKNGTMVGSGKGTSEQEAKEDFMAYHKSENPTVTKVKLYKSLDNAIRNMDSVKYDVREVYNILAQALQNSTNPNKVSELISKAQGKLLEMAARAKDSKCKPAIDSVIRNCDVNKAEGFKIYNAYVRNDTLYIEYEDLLYGNGKKEKESFTRTEAKKLLTDPWNTWLGTSKMVVKQFAG